MVMNFNSYKLNKEAIQEPMNKDWKPTTVDGIECWHIACHNELHVVLFVVLLPITLDNMS